MAREYTVDELIENQKRKQREERIKNKVNEVKDWCELHRQEILLATPVVLGAVTTVVKVGGRRANLSKEQDLKELYVYDKSLGHYWELKRKLKNDEWLEIERRKVNGESLGDILSELKVLK